MPSERAHDREAPHPFKGTGGKSGGCAPKAVELTSGGLPSVAETRLRKKQFFLIRRQKSAAGVLLRETGGRPKR